MSLFLQDADEEAMIAKALEEPMEEPMEVNSPGTEQVLNETLAQVINEELEVNLDVSKLAKLAEKNFSDEDADYLDLGENIAIDGNSSERTIESDCSAKMSTKKSPSAEISSHTLDLLLKPCQADKQPESSQRALHCTEHTTVNSPSPGHQRSPSPKNIESGPSHPHSVKSKSSSPSSRKSKSLSPHSRRSKSSNSSSQNSRSSSPQSKNSRSPSPKSGKSRSPSPKSGKSRSPNSKSGRSRSPSPKSGRSRSPSPKSGRSRSPSSKSGRSRSSSPKSRSSRSSSPKSRSSRSSSPKSRRSRSSSPKSRRSRSSSPKSRRSRSSSPKSRRSRSSSLKSRRSRSSSPKSRKSRSSSPKSRRSRSSSPKSGRSRSSSSKLKESRSPSPNSRVGNMQSRSPSPSDRKSSKVLSPGSHRSRSINPRGQKSLSASPKSNRSRTPSPKIRTVTHRSPESSRDRSPGMKATADSDGPLQNKKLKVMQHTDSDFEGNTKVASKSKLTSDSESDRPDKSRGNKKKKKRKIENDLDSDSDGMLEKPRKEKKKKHKRKSIKMKIKIPKHKEKKQDGSSFSSTQSVEGIPQVVSLDMISFSTSTSTLASLPPHRRSPPPIHKSLRIENASKRQRTYICLLAVLARFSPDPSPSFNGCPPDWVYNLVKATFTEKKIFTASLWDKGVDQLTSCCLVIERYWSTGDIAEATRCRPASQQPYVPANYVMPKTKFTRNELTDPEVNRIEHEKKRKRSIEREDKHKKHHKEEKKHKKHKHKIKEDQEDVSIELKQLDCHQPGINVEAMEVVDANVVAVETNVVAVETNPDVIIAPVQNEEAITEISTPTSTALLVPETEIVVTDTADVVTDVVTEPEATVQSSEVAEEEVDVVQNRSKVIKKEGKAESSETKKSKLKPKKSDKATKKQEQNKKDFGKFEHKRVVAQLRPIPEPKPAPAFKIPKKVQSDPKPLFDEPPKTKIVIRRPPFVPKAFEHTVVHRNSSSQTDPISCLSNYDGPTVEDLMLLARSQIRDNPIVLAQWSRRHVMSAEEMTRLQKQFNFTDDKSKSKTKISMDAYNRRLEQNRREDTKSRSREHVNGDVRESQYRDRLQRDSRGRALVTTQDRRVHQESNESNKSNTFLVPKVPNKHESPSNRASTARTPTQSPKVATATTPNFKSASVPSCSTASPESSPPDTGMDNYSADDDDDAISLSFNEELSVTTTDESVLLKMQTGKMRPSTNNPFKSSTMPSPGSASSQNVDKPKKPIISPWQTPPLITSSLTRGTSPGHNRSPILGADIPSANSLNLAPLGNASKPAATATNSQQALLKLVMSNSIGKASSSSLQDIQRFEQEREEQERYRIQQEEARKVLELELRHRFEILDKEAVELSDQYREAEHIRNVQIPQNIVQFEREMYRLQTNDYNGRQQYLHQISLLQQDMEKIRLKMTTMQGRYNSLVAEAHDIKQKLHQLLFERNQAVLEASNRAQGILQVLSQAQTMVNAANQAQNVVKTPQMDNAVKSPKQTQNAIKSSSFSPNIDSLSPLIDTTQSFMEPQHVAKEPIVPTNIESSLGSPSSFEARIRERNVAELQKAACKEADELVNGMKPALSLVPETNEERNIMNQINGQHKVPRDFALNACKPFFTLVGCHHSNCQFSHEEANIRDLMRDMPVALAVQLYLYIRSKCYRYYYRSAFVNILGIITRYRCSQSALVVCYELMTNIQEYREQWWSQMISTLLFIKDSLGEDNEFELKRVLIHVLNHDECDTAMRNDIAKVSEKTFQYIPEVWSEIFKDPDYLLPEEILHLLVKILVENRNKKWARIALEILVIPTSESFWKSLPLETVNILMDLCTNESVKQTLKTKCSGPLPLPVSSPISIPLPGSQSSLLLPPPMPPRELLDMDKMDVDDEPYSPSQDDDLAIADNTGPRPNMLELLLNGQENKEQLRVMYNALGDAIETLQWQNVVYIVTRFPEVKLPRGRCLYNILKEKLVKPAIGYFKILEAARNTECKSTELPKTNENMRDGMQFLLGTVGINIMFDLFNNQKYMDATRMYSEVTKMTKIKLNNITSYHDEPITCSQILLLAGKSFLKMNEADRACFIFKELIDLKEAKNDEIIVATEAMTEHFLNKGNFAFALQAFDGTVIRKTQMCQEANIDYEPPKFGNDLLAFALSQTDNSVVEHMWKHMCHFPQHLEKRTIRSAVIRFCTTSRMLMKAAYQAGRLNDTYPVQMPHSRPRTIRMRSYWTIQEMVVIVEDFLTRIEFIRGKDHNLDDFDLIVHIEEQDMPRPVTQSQYHAPLPEINCSIEAAAARVHDAFRRMNPPVECKRTPQGDHRLVYVLPTSVRMYLRELYRSR